MSVTFVQRTGACLALLTLGALACAQDAPPAGALTLEQALARTVGAHPELVVLGYQIDAARGRLRQAELGPNPVLNVALEDALGTDAFRGARNAETTITLDWVLERGLRERRIGVARADVSLNAFDAELARLDTAAETARRFLVSLAFQARAGNAAQAVQLAEETVAAVRQRVDAGLTPRAELERAEAALARAELVEEDIEHELRTAYRRLSAQWGETQPDFDVVRGSLDALPPSDSFAALLARADRNPELARFASRRRVDEAELQLAEAERRPRWTVSTGMRRFERGDDVALVAGVQMPLAVRNRNEGRIAAARAELMRTDAAADAARVRLETTLYALHQELEHSLHVAERLTADVIPRLERALEETRRAYRLGRYGFFEWRSVQAELLDARDALLEASVDAHSLRIEIERLTGVAGGLQSAAE